MAVSFYSMGDDFGTVPTKIGLGIGQFYMVYGVDGTFFAIHNNINVTRGAVPENGRFRHIYK